MASQCHCAVYVTLTLSSLVIHCLIGLTHHLELVVMEEGGRKESWKKHKYNNGKNVEYARLDEMSILFFFCSCTIFLYNILKVCE